MEKLITGRQEFISHLSEYRLGKIFQGAEEYLHPELTLPVQTEPIGEPDPLLARNPALQTAINEHLRVVITPHTTARLGDEQLMQVRILIAAPESGRVFEADREVEVDGKKRVLSFKGVGATGFVRYSTRDSVFRKILRESTPIHATQTLAVFPFLGKLGSLGQSEGEAERMSAIHMSELGEPSEVIPQLYRITSMPDVDGHYRPIHHFYQHNVGYEKYAGGGYIGTPSPPILMPRLTKTLVRVYDPIAMMILEKPEASENILSHLQTRYAEEIGTDQVSISEYYQFIMGSSISQQLRMTLRGYFSVSPNVGWEAVARNISGLAEKLDQQIPTHPELKDVREYYANMSQAAMKLYTMLQIFTITINRLFPGTNTPAGCLDMFESIAMNAIERTDVDQAMASIIATSPSNLDHYTRNTKSKLTDLLQGFLQSQRVVLRNRASSQSLQFF